MKTILLQNGILRRLWRKKQYYTAFLGGFAAMPLISGIIKRIDRFIRNKYKIFSGCTSRHSLLFERIFYSFMLPSALNSGSFSK
ncbi:MAG: hypothetical protein E7434_01775 [Ruminococcaceae bacterium]|nr:hypothetical protein [Oscillospiraceae bacterium]